MAAERCGPWEIISKLGQGGFGDIYLGQTAKTGENVVIKRAKRTDMEGSRDLCREAVIMEYIKRQCEARGGCDIVQIVGDCFPTQDSIWVVMEYLGKEDGWYELWGMREHLPNISVLGRLEIAIGIAQAIAQIHSMGVASRDIKPENVMINPVEEKVKLIDFGLSCLDDTAREMVKIPTKRSGLLRQDKVIRKVCQDLYFSCPTGGGSLGTELYFHQQMGTVPYSLNISYRSDVFAFLVMAVELNLVPAEDYLTDIPIVSMKDWLSAFVDFNPMTGLGPTILSDVQAEEIAENIVDIWNLNLEELIQTEAEQFEAIMSQSAELEIITGEQGGAMIGNFIRQRKRSLPEWGMDIRDADFPTILHVIDRLLAIMKDLEDEEE